MRDPESIAVNEDARLIPWWSVAAAITAFAAIEYYMWAVLPSQRHHPGPPLGFKIYFNLSFGLLATILALRNISGTSVPYDVPKALAVLKLPLGALCAIGALVSAKTAAAVAAHRFICVSSGRSPPRSLKLRRTRRSLGEGGHPHALTRFACLINCSRGPTPARVTRASRS